MNGNVSNGVDMAWLQPRPLTQEELQRLARAQAYAARTTGDSGGLEERQDITSSVPNGTAEDKVR